jgi:hypothetical protein
VQQCDIVNNFFPHSCCPNDCGASCDQAYLSSAAIDYGGHLASATNTTCSFETIVSEISALRPVGVAIFPAAGTGHALVIYGYYDCRDWGQWLILGDPDLNVQWSYCPYSSFPSANYAGYSWDRTNFTQ